jgi:hypothetical protein
MKIQPLLEFMRLRHTVYLRRAAGEQRPWTADPILRAYKFCNVYRELDTVTRWVKKNVRDRYSYHRYLWFMVCVARHFNWPPTLMKLREEQAWPNTHWSPLKAAGVLQRWGAQAYTGAYMVNPPTRAELNALPAHLRTKVAWSCVACLGQLWAKRDELTERLEAARTLQAAHQVLDGAARGWAGFTAYEVVSDLRWTRYLNRAPDIMTWAHLGPGALRGLQRVFGRPVNQRPPQDLALREVREVHRLLSEAWPTPQPWPNKAAWPKLEMREVEHSLCEFDKYKRVRLGEGRPRSRYNGLTEEVK